MAESEQGARLHVGLISRGYPNLALPHQAPFVQVVARGLADTGARVSVVVPRAWGREPVRLDPTTEREDLARGLTVVSPRHVSFSRRVLPGGFATFPLSVWGFTRAVKRALSRLPERPSILYGHFAYPAGHAAVHLGAKLGIPSVVVLGESRMEEYEVDLGLDTVRAMLGRANAILSVSEENADYCTSRLGLDRARITVIPNAVDLQTFQPRDRAQMRVKHGLPADEPIVAFVGYFIDRKGPLRVAEALSRTASVKGVFIGDGPEVPRGDRVLHAGRVPHAEVPEWLGAADLFVLPTRAEGSPNAVLEAMACGLPVVTSDVPALRECVDPEQGVLVDPDDVEGLARAIERILGDEDLRRAMSASALARARGNSLERRVARIRAWLEATIAAA